MNIQKDNLFNQEELNELEMLEVKGGVNSCDTIQNQCPNYVAGCGCSIIAPDEPVKNI